MESSWEEPKSFHHRRMKSGVKSTENGKTFKRVFCCYSGSSGKLSLHFLCLHETLFFLSFFVSALFMVEEKISFCVFSSSLWLMNCSQMNTSVCLIIPFVLKKTWIYEKFLKTSLNGKSFSLHEMKSVQEDSFCSVNRWGEVCVNLQFYEIAGICEKTAKHWESLVVCEAASDCAKPTNKH